MKKQIFGFYWGFLYFLIELTYISMSVICQKYMNKDLKNDYYEVNINELYYIKCIKVNNNILMMPIYII